MYIQKERTNEWKKQDQKEDGLKKAISVVGFI